MHTAPQPRSALPRPQALELRFEHSNFKAKIARLENRIVDLETMLQTSDGPVRADRLLARTAAGLSVLGAFLGKWLR